MQTIRAAAIQLVSRTDPTVNRRSVVQQVAAAAQAGADWVLLPEYWPLMGRHDTDKLTLAEQFGSGSLQIFMAELAARHRIVLFGGSIPLLASQSGKIINSLLVYGRDGQCLSRYDKAHLFSYTGIGESYREADTIEAGNQIPAAAEADGWRYGQGICYDLRFPEIFRAQQPFDVLLLPAAFTYTTGKAHWQTLLQARAIENQCYVIAAAQGGLHDSGRRTYGHSMIIDPWGEVLAELPEDEGWIIAELNPQRLHSVRNQLPALQHRRF